MSRRLDDLSPRFRRVAVEFLARLTEAQIAVRLLDTRRTESEQVVLIQNGAGAERSKHLTGDAIDVCPYATYALEAPDTMQWDVNHPIWQRIRSIGEGIGLRWGGPEHPWHFECRQEDE